MKLFNFLKERLLGKRYNYSKKKEKKDDLSKFSGVKNYKLLKSNTHYIKAFPLLGLADIPSVQSELKSGNIVILNISHFIQKSDKYRELKRAVEQLSYVTKIYEGEIAQLGEKYLLLTPTPNIKIWREEFQVNH